MSLEEYHARQRANEGQNQASIAAALRKGNAAARRHLKRELLDPEADSEAYREIEKALKALT